MAGSHHLLIHANELSTLALPMYHGLPNLTDAKHPFWVLFAMLSSGWATTTGRLKWEISLKSLSQGHSDAIQRKSQRQRWDRPTAQNLSITDSDAPPLSHRRGIYQI